MVRRVLTMLSAALLAACASEPAVSDGSGVRVAKPLGSVQCSGGGTPVAEMARQMTAGGVKVLASSCATDGRMYAAMCGASDGRLGVLEIRAADLKAAEAMGFKPLDQWRGAAAVPCK
jgi:allophanate hydrolase subunit 2